MTDEPIVSGGGWKQEPGSTPVYVGALSCLVLACVCGIYAPIHSGALRWVTAIAGGLLFILAIVLSHFEKPLQIPDSPDADEDPHNLYLANGAKTLPEDSQQSKDGDAERRHDSNS